jgi:hypothetical protein
MSYKTCACEKKFLTTHIKRHQSSCKEYYAFTKTEELRSKLEKSEELISMLHNADVVTFQKRIHTLETELKDKDETFKKELKEKDDEMKKQFKEKDDDFKKQLKEKDDQIKKLQNALINKPTFKNCNVNHNIHNGDVNNVVNVVNAWGNETFDHITEEDKIRALRNYMTAIPNIVEQIHFGEERKNRNVKLPNKRAREVVIYKEMPNGEVKPVHEDLNDILEEMIANGKYVLDPVAERLNMTKYKKFREDLRESERIKGKLYAEQKSAVKRKLMDNTELQ